MKNTIRFSLLVLALANPAQSFGQQGSSAMTEQTVSALFSIGERTAHQDSTSEQRQAGLEALKQMAASMSAHEKVAVIDHALRGISAAEALSSIESASSYQRAKTSLILATTATITIVILPDGQLRAGATLFAIVSGLVTLYHYSQGDSIKQDAANHALAMRNALISYRTELNMQLRAEALK